MALYFWCRHNMVALERQLGPYGNVSDVMGAAVKQKNGPQLQSFNLLAIAANLSIGNTNEATEIAR